MENPDEKLLWTMDQVADQFGVCTKTISRLITNGELPVVRIGRHVRIEARVVHHFVEQARRYNQNCAGLVVRHPQGERKCLSSANVRKASNNEKTVRTGGHLSQTQVVEEFNALLGQPTRGKR